MKGVMVWDYLMAGITVLVGVAEAAHLAGMIFGWSFGRCTLLFAVLLGIGCAAGAGIWFLSVRRHGAALYSREDVNGAAAPVRRHGDALPQEPKEEGRGRFIYVIFILLVISQLIFICMGDTDYREGDMTVETVGSFLQEDGIYRVNPLTGMPYTAGMPSRVKVLCLPSLYGFLCKLTGFSAAAVVRNIVPAVILLCSYAAYRALACSLFPREGGRRLRRACFMTIVSLLMWTGTYAFGMDGFGLLVCGWRGTSIRNGVLLPWLFSLCIRRKWLWTVLCIAAEACIVWTLYGCGTCLGVTAGMAAAHVLSKRLGRMRDASKRTPEEEGLI